MAFSTDKLVAHCDKLKLPVMMIIASLSFGCAHGRNYRIYVHDAKRGLFIRDLKNKEVLTYKEGHNFICIPQDELRKMVNDLATKKAYGR